MSWLSRLKNALHPRRVDEELEQELRDHLERRAAALRAKGFTTEEAQREAPYVSETSPILRNRVVPFVFWPGSMEPCKTCATAGAAYGSPPLLQVRPCCRWP